MPRRTDDDWTPMAPLAESEREGESAGFDAADDIAIVGMAGRFPGAASVAALWDNLCAGVSGIRELEEVELRAAGVPESTRSAPHFVPVAADLADADAFDASFFGISPREAELMDPQHRVFLEIAWAALEDAGYDAERLRVPVGVFGGVAPNTYAAKNLATRPELLERVGNYLAMISSEKEYAITRTSFKLNLRGPAVSVHTACSTTGVAAHLACQSVLSGECDMAIVGGGRVRVPLASGYLYQQDGILSPDGRCRAFDAEARGTVAGNGMAAIVIKRLADAIADRDTVYALIKSTAINNDGSAKAGFTAPSVHGQAAVIREALALADIDPRTIGYVEAHGTGTTLGDPIEIQGLTEAYRQYTSDKQFCAIGSIKTNIGHLDAGAGVAGIIKAALALRHATIPPSLNFERPNPQIDFEGSPFYVNASLAQWRDGEHPRRAGVSSFGLGGTNAHVILEEPPAARAAESGTHPQSSREHEVLVLSAKTPAALDRATANLSSFLRQRTDLSLADVGYTLAAGRAEFAHRRRVVASNASEAADLLSQALESTSTTCDAQAAPNVTFLFPGQGSQYLRMGSALASEPVYRSAFDQCADLMRAGLGEDLRSVVAPPETSDDEEATALLRQTRFTQPALFAIEYALAQWWLSLGIEPSAMVGHSVGEFVAATIAGVFSLESAAHLVVERARFMQDLPAGSMLSVRLPEDDLAEHLSGQLAIAAANGPQHCVAAGPHAEVEELQQRLSGSGVACRRLHTSHAFHSPMMDSIVEPFADRVRRVKLSAPRRPFVSTVTGTWIEDSEATDPMYWARHLRATVRFSKAVAGLCSDATSRVFIEVGPRTTLATLTRQHTRGTAHIALSSLADSPQREWPSLLATVGDLWTRGVSLECDALFSTGTQRRISLPTYPFERTRYWVTPSASISAKSDGRDDSGRAGSHSATTSPADGTTPDASQHPDGRGAASQRAGQAAGSSLATPSDQDQETHDYDRVATAIRRITSELSGIPAADISEDETFVALGFDSLLMTQLNEGFQRHFAVPLTLRNLLDTTPTVRDLSRYIDQQTSTTRVSDGNGDGNGALKSNGQANGQHADSRATSESETATEPNESSELEATQRSTEQRSPQRFGPWRAPARRETAELDVRGREILDGLIERYVGARRGSRHLAELQRPQFADPRAVSEFRRESKEMVFQIAIDRAAGSRVWDIDGNEYVDLTLGYGVNLFGHSPSFVVEAVERQLHRDFAVGTNTPLASQVVELLCALTGCQRAALVVTGSEAVIAAVRAARTVTMRSKVAVLRGDYHGVADEFLVRAMEEDGSWKARPAAPGIPSASVTNVVVIDPRAPDAMAQLEAQASTLAAVLVEPVQARNPDLDLCPLLQRIRAVTKKTGTALIFDEMITGFRLAPGGSARALRRARGHRLLRQSAQRWPASCCGRWRRAIPGRIRRRPMAVRRCDVPRSGRHILRRHERQAPISARGCPRSTFALARPRRRTADRTRGAL